MDSDNGLNYIDGYNLDFSELKFRLQKMGVENLDYNTDFSYFADLYNNILASKNYVLVSKIKNLLDEDMEKSNFSDLLSKKRGRTQDSERKENSSYNIQPVRAINGSNNFKNG